MEFEDLSVYILSLIVQDLTLEELDQLCLLNPELDQKICSNNEFWEQIYLSKFGSPLTSPLIWKEAYRQKLSNKVFSSGERTCTPPENRIISSNIPEQILPLVDVGDIINISAGSSYTLILTSTGEVYACGSNEYGQLGLGVQQEQITSPQRIPLSEKIISISAGLSHSLILAQNGKVYAFGENDFGQLGFGDQQDRYQPERIFLGLNPGEKIIAISAGRGFSLILTENGKVYAFGNNYSGQLGLGDQQNRFVPERIVLRLNPGEKIIAVSAGHYHSLILTSIGKVYAFGLNNRGQLGLGNQTDQLSPQQILIEEKIIAISAGEYHSLILTENGEVYAFGWNIQGQLGIGRVRTELQVTIPQKISSPKEFIAISAGSTHSLFLSSKGSVYTVGTSRMGEMGLGVGYSTIVYLRRIPIKEKIMAIAAGNIHSLFLAQGFASFDSIQTLIQRNWVQSFELKYKTSIITAVFEFIDLQDYPYLIEVRYNPKTNEIFPFKNVFYYFGKIVNGEFLIFLSLSKEDKTDPRKRVLGKPCENYSKEELLDILTQLEISIPYRPSIMELCDLVQQSFEKYGLIED